MFTGKVIMAGNRGRIINGSALLNNHRNWYSSLPGPPSGLLKLRRCCRQERNSGTHITTGLWTACSVIEAAGTSVRGITIGDGRWVLAAEAFREDVASGAEEDDREKS
jgi:hypothetical protein